MFECFVYKNTGEGRSCCVLYRRVSITSYEVFASIPGSLFEYHLYPVCRNNRGISLASVARLLLILQHDTHLTWPRPIEEGKFWFLPLNLAEILRRCHNGPRGPSWLLLISCFSQTSRVEKFQVPRGVLIVAKTSLCPLLWKLADRQTGI